MTLQDFKNYINSFLKAKPSSTNIHPVNRWLQTLEDAALNSPDTGEFEGSRERMFTQIKQALNNRSHQRNARLAWSLAASVLLLIMIGYTYRTELHNAIDPVEMITYSTHTGQQRLIYLPDHTAVWLNAASTLQVPEEFRGDTRHISLKGEAFFNVQHDASKPFYVHTGKAFTRVVGTSFNVKAYSADEPIDVTLLTGKVAVGFTDSLDRQHELVQLTPNQHVRMSARTYELKKDSVLAETAMAWTKQQLVFRQATLKEMALTLERWYSVSIKIDASAGNPPCTFSAEYVQGTSLDDILKSLALTDNLTFTRNHNAIIIHPRNNCQ